MQIHIHQIYKLFLILSLSYYMGIVTFLNSLIAGGAQRGTLEGNASGSIVNQLVGLGLLGLAGVFFIFARNFTVKDIFSQGKLWWLLIAFFILSISWSYEPSVSFRRIVAFSTLVITCYCLTNIYSAKSLVNCLAELIFIVAIVGFIYHLATVGSLTFGFGERGAALRGLFADKNGAARVYAYGIIMLVALKRYKAWADILKLGFLCFALLASSSATGVVIAFFGVGLLVLFDVFKAKDKQQTTFQFIILIITLIAGGYLVSVLYEFLLSLLDRDPELTNRAIIWELLLPLIESEWVKGYGFGAFWASSAVEGFVERWGFIGNAHNGYYEAMLHGGVFCVALLALIVINQFKNVFALYIDRVKDDLSSLFFVLLIIQVVINAVGYIILNHNSFDMFLFTLLYFLTTRQISSKTSIFN